MVMGIPAKEQQLIFFQILHGETNVNNKRNFRFRNWFNDLKKKIIELHGGEIKLVSKEKHWIQIFCLFLE